MSAIHDQLDRQILELMNEPKVSIHGSEIYDDENSSLPRQVVLFVEEPIDRLSAEYPRSFEVTDSSGKTLSIPIEYQTSTFVAST